MNINNRVRKLVILGLMLAITVILDVTPLSAIPIGSVSATIVHLPAILTGIILGPLYGLIMSGLFGLVSLVHAATRPVSPLDPLFINPLLSIAPRLLIGVVAYYGYQGTVKVWEFLFKGSILQAKHTVGGAVGGILGSLTNTILTLGTLYLLYVQDIIEKLGLSDATAVRVMLIGVVTSNALIEAVVAGVLVAAITSAYFSIFKRRIE